MCLKFLFAGFVAGLVTLGAGLPDRAGHIVESIPEARTDDRAKNWSNVLDKFTWASAGKYVTIGNKKISKSEVTDVGDIDGNGYMDYIVAKPLARNRTGSIRLYLMKDHSNFLFSRELVPGSWGFKAPALRSGDRFGSAVFKIPRGNEDMPTQIAIGAPGDADGKGAIYLVVLSKRASVIKFEKVSADTQHSLSKQHENSEGFGTDINATGDLNGNMGLELAVNSLSGHPTILFLKPAGDASLGLKVNETATPGLMKLINRRPTSIKRTRFDIDVLTVRAGVAADCFFNEASCVCSLMPVVTGSSSCMDVVGTDAGTGRTICRMRDCEASYQCNCDGKELCKREEVTSTSFTSQGSAPGGDVYCSTSSSSGVKNFVQVGVPIPTPKEEPEALPFNSTHCGCSLKSDVLDASECLDFLRTMSNGAALCSTRQCKDRSDDYICDGLGSFYCKRENFDSQRYVSDGNSGEAGVKYCHSETHNAEKITRTN